MQILSNLDGSYYTSIRYWNSVETVSSNMVSFASIQTNYSFNAQSDIYRGNVLQSTDGNWLIYGGDVNQDGLLDSSDMIPIDNLSAAFANGYIPEDANGDGLIDSSDMVIVDNNVIRFISKITP